MVAFRLPNNFRAIFAEGAFNAAFLPRYTAAATKDGHGADIRRHALRRRCFLLAGFRAARPARSRPRLHARESLRSWPRASPTTRIRCTLPSSFPGSLSLSALHHHRDADLRHVERGGKFRAAAASPILLNIAMIGTLLAASYFPSAAHAAAYGVLIAGFLQLLYMVRAGAKNGLHLHLRLPRWRPEVKEFAGGARQRDGGRGQRADRAFHRHLIASFLPSGELTALYYADRINQLPMGIIGVALGTVLLPEMSAKLAAQDEKARASRRTARSSWACC